MVAVELAVEAILELVSKLLRCGVRVRESFDGDGDWVGGLIPGRRLVDDEGLWDDWPLDLE